MQAKIRKAKARDIWQIVGLLGKLSGFETKIDNVCAYRKGFEKNEAKKLARLIGSKKHAVFAAEAGKKIVGMCIARVDIWPEKFARNKWIEIKELFVEESYRRKGIAKLLIKEIEKKYAGKANGFEMYCLKGNKQALKAYKKLGFFEWVTWLRKEN